MSYIFAHGLGQKAESWDKTTAALDLDGEVLCPELMPLMDGKESVYNNLYAAFSRYCNNVDDKLNLCGLSLGAVLALNFAIDNPQKVSSLVLIAPQDRMPGAVLALQNLMVRFMPKDVFSGMGFGKEEFIKMTSSMSRLNFRGQLGQVTCPTLVLCGEKDSANRQAAEKIAAGIADARLKYIEGSGHEVNVDAPGRLSDELAAFYSRPEQ